MTFLAGGLPPADELGSPDSEIYAPSGSGVAPASPFDAPDMWTVFGGGGSSPASPMLIKIMPSFGLPKPSPFNQATAETFENLNDKWLSDVQRVQVAVLLQMISLDDITSVSGLSQKLAIDLLGLRRRRSHLSRDIGQLGASGIGRKAAWALR